MANSVDSDETARYEPSHLDLYCFDKYLFGSTVYNRAKVYIQQNFLKVVVHVIIIDHEIVPRARSYKFQATVIRILVTVTSECRIKRAICKTWTGTLANSADRY